LLPLLFQLRAKPETMKFAEPTVAWVLAGDCPGFDNVMGVAILHTDHAQSDIADLSRAWIPERECDMGEVGAV
jgi:hypothetical protein